ncbi:MAG TPA: alpha/beta hydrolase [Hyphomicrobiaceae bacterium]|nr:alpha/beta hydrolase [Hyphomicrobiaceae bacterium]
MAATAAAKPAYPREAYEFSVEDIEYLRHDSGPLLLRLFKPKGAGPFPLMIDLHGGAWCSQDRTSDAMFNEALARSGVVVAALDFRMPPTAAYPASLADINYATRWLKSRAGEFGARPGRVGMIGISSGGHQAMLAAMRPRDKRYAAIPLAGHPDVDAGVAAVVMVWPVIDPLHRYRYAKGLQAARGTYPEQIDRVIPLHIKFWGNEEAMEEGNPVGILDRGEPVEMPPVLYVQGAEDIVHPKRDLERFVAGYAKRGGKVDLALYQGEGGGFIRDPNSRAAPLAMQRIVDFVHKELG